MKRFLYRILRDDMVIRMRTRGFTWSKINQVLKSLEQKQITHYVVGKKGLRIYFKEPADKQAEKVR